MGRQERAEFKAELEKLGRSGEEGPDYYTQNDRVTAAEQNVNVVENLWVRGQVR